jgi:beta-galactosidase/beta-glucuronidase
VWLNITDGIHVAPNGTSITTPGANAQTANISITTTVKNDSVAPAVVGVVSTIVDASGKVVATVTDSAEVAAGATREVASVTKVDRPELWMPGHPAMYTLQTKLFKGPPAGGAAVDTYSTPFGIRDFKFDPAKGFSINGESMKIKGVCLHHDAGVLGAAVPIQVWERRLKLLQEAGVNAIRCSHNPPDPQLLDLYDRAWAFW